MWRLIRYMRRQPRAVRSQVAFVTSLTVTGIIATVWLVAKPANNFGEVIVSTAADGKIQEHSSFFVTQIKSQFAAVMEGVSAFTNTNEDGAATSSVETVAPAPAVVMPQLTPQNTTTSTNGTSTLPKTARVILIATTSASSSSQ